MPAGRRAYHPGHGAARCHQGARACLAPDPALRPRLRAELDDRRSFSMATAKKTAISRADILPPAEYAAKRLEMRKAVVALKRKRRLEVGPVATFYFESYETMLQQVQ